jgi:hypothetical protein
MAGRRSIQILVSGALIATVLTLPALSCPPTEDSYHFISDASADKSKSERCKRPRSSSKECPDGGERLPQDKRSPRDNLSPLAPLVA